jgi:peroxiredoxin
MAEAYGVKGGAYANRTTFVVGPEGNVIKVVEGRDALDPTGALDACPIHKKKG